MFRAALQNRRIVRPVMALPREGVSGMSDGRYFFFSAFSIMAMIADGLRPVPFQLATTLPSTRKEKIGEPAPEMLAAIGSCKCSISRGNQNAEGTGDWMSLVTLV